jgi:hypothetical protein
MSETADGPDVRAALWAAGAVLGGIVVPGLISRALYAAGLPTLGAFAFGFVGMLVVVWYVWLRPMDITGPIE